MKINDYLKIGQASQILGVSTQTLRKWDKMKKLISYKVPGSNSRLYKKEDLENFLNEIKPVE